jgi:putative endonuclease
MTSEVGQRRCLKRGVIPAQAGIHLALCAATGDHRQMRKTFCVYMLASKPNGTLYIGVTSNLPARLWQHRNHVMSGFTSRYDVTRLVWYEVHESAEAAIGREKQLKEWRRAWKVRLLSATNPDWADLAPRVLAEWGGGGREEDGSRPSSG